MVVLVQGPPGVGKTLLIKALIQHYTRQSLSNPQGPVTVVAGKQRRITFVECPQVWCSAPDACYCHPIGQYQFLVAICAQQASLAGNMPPNTQLICLAVQDLHGMIDAAKYADLVLLLIDGAYGFEMETFEFLNILQVCLEA